MVETDRIFLDLNITYLPNLVYAAHVDQDWIRKKSLKKLEIPEFRAYNQWNCALYAQELAGIRQKLDIRWINPLKGYGLFASEDIPEMVCVGEYTGLVKKRDKKQDRDNSYIFEYSIDTLDTGYVIDAEKQGNHTRFINHSDEPNLLSRWLLIDGLPRVIFFTKHFIPKDVELTVDYGPYYWQ